MSDNNKSWYLDDDKAGLWTYILGRMTLGAAYAAAVFFGVVILILVLRWIGSILPEDPTGYTALPLLQAVIA